MNLQALNSYIIFLNIYYIGIVSRGSYFNPVLACIPFPVMPRGGGGVDFDIILRGSCPAVNVYSRSFRDGSRAVDLGYGNRRFWYSIDLKTVDAIGYDIVIFKGICRNDQKRIRSGFCYGRHVP